MNSIFKKIENILATKYFELTKKEIYYIGGNDVLPPPLEKEDEEGILSKEDLTDEEILDFLHGQDNNDGYLIVKAKASNHKHSYYDDVSFWILSNEMKNISLEEYLQSYDVEKKEIDAILNYMNVYI